MIACRGGYGDGLVGDLWGGGAGTLPPSPGPTMFPEGFDSIRMILRASTGPAIYVDFTRSIPHGKSSLESYPANLELVTMLDLKPTLVEVSKGSGSPTFTLPAIWRDLNVADSVAGQT